MCDLAGYIFVALGLAMFAVGTFHYRQGSWFLNEARSILTNMRNLEAETQAIRDEWKFAKKSLSP